MCGANKAVKSGPNYDVINIMRNEGQAQGFGTEGWLEHGLELGNVDKQKLNQEVVTVTTETTEIDGCVSKGNLKLGLAMVRCSIMGWQCLECVRV